MTKNSTASATVNIVQGSCALLAALMLYSGVSKLLNYDRFADALAQSPFLHGRSLWLSYLLPPVEVSLAAFLLLGWQRSFFLYSYLYLMFSFTAYIFLMMHKAYYLPCACMGLFESIGWRAHLWLNIGIISLNLLAIFANKGKSKGVQNLAYTENYR